MVLTVLALSAALAQQGVPQVEAGVLPRAWLTGGPNCLELPDWQIHEYNADFFILRESGCSHYEKPFLYLIFGEKRVLLEDTGAGKTEVAKVVTRLIAEWAARKKMAAPPLLVVHSHSHGDHTAGDAQFAALPNAELVKAGSPLDATIDLGNRMIDVIPIPGHDAASIALYDRQTGILLTGDSLYPGRLYVRDFAAFTASIRRLVEFTRDKPVAHILGTHIEQTRTPFIDYKVGTRYQPDEHVLELSRGDLLELDDALASRKDKPMRRLLGKFTIVTRIQLP